MAREFETPAGGLTPLSDMGDYEVADGYVDVRGFEVWDEQGDVIGEVDDLLVDPSSEEVRFLVVELDEDAVSGMTDEEEIRIPVRAVTILEDDEAVRLTQPIGVFAPGLASGGAVERDLAAVDEEPTGAPGRDLRSDPVPTHPVTSREAGRRGGLVIEPDGAGGDVVGTEPRSVEPGWRIRRRMS